MFVPECISEQCCCCSFTLTSFISLSRPEQFCVLTSRSVLLVFPHSFFTVGPRSHTTPIHSFSVWTEKVNSHHSPCRIQSTLSTQDVCMEWDCKPAHSFPFVSHPALPTHNLARQSFACILYLSDLYLPEHLYLHPRPSPVPILCLALVLFFTCWVIGLSGMLLLILFQQKSKHLKVFWAITQE